MEYLHIIVKSYVAHGIKGVGEIYTCLYVYSGPPLIRTPLLPNNSVLIREVSFGEREHYIHS